MACCGKDAIRSALCNWQPPLATSLVCGLIRCEVGRGLRQTKVLHRFQAFWDLMVDVPADPALWNSALELAWRLDRRGIVLPLSDVIIASAAIRIGAVVLNRDSHFARIPGLHVCQEIV